MSSQLNSEPASQLRNQFEPWHETNPIELQSTPIKQSNSNQHQSWNTQSEFVTTRLGYKMTPIKVQSDAIVQIELN